MKVSCNSNSIFGVSHAKNEMKLRTSIPVGKGVSPMILLPLQMKGTEKKKQNHQTNKD